LLGDNAVTAGHLAEHAGLTGAAVTALVDRLEAAGYVVRERDDNDRRKVLVRAITAKVRELDELYDSHAAEMSRLLSRYSASEFAAITDYFSKATKILATQTMKLRNDGLESKLTGTPKSKRRPSSDTREADHAAPARISQELPAEHPAGRLSKKSSTRRN
jgi:DNA-binding MarR family transcriptional regulator